MRSHRDLDVWKLSVALVSEVYAVTRTFPQEEMYGLVNQMRRAAVSVPSKIAEGDARVRKRNFSASCQLLSDRLQRWRLRY